jgi:hypothetical protein
MMIGMGMPIRHHRMPRMRTLPGVETSAPRDGASTSAGHRRRLCGLLAMLLVAGCETDPMGNHLWGFGDPVRGAALYAPRNLGNTARWDGQPAQAAQAAAQLEFLAVEMRTNPRYAPAVSPTVVQQLDRGRDEMRQFLGIAPDAPAQAVITALRQAAAALRDGDRGRAETLLDQPRVFTAGPLVTLARLNAMPRLPQVAIAANQVANEINRLDNRRV